MRIVSNRKGVREATLTLIQRLTGNSNILTIPVELIHYTGSLDCALFLSQMLYWTERATIPGGWVYKTYKEWKKELHLSEFEVRKAVKILGKDGKGILETKLKKANGSPTVHYRLLVDRFSDSILNFLQERSSSKSVNQDSESEETLTETTTQITSTERERLAYASSHSGNIFGGNSVASLESSSDTHTAPTGPSSASAKSPAALMPKDFHLTRDMLFWAGEEAGHVDVRETTQRFIDHYRSHPKKSADWVAEWRNWMRRELEYERNRQRDDDYRTNRQGDAVSSYMDVYEAILDYVWESNCPLSRNQIDAEFSDLSEQTISKCLEEAVKNGGIGDGEFGLVLNNGYYWIPDSAFESGDEQNAKEQNSPPH